MPSSDPDTPTDERTPLLPPRAPPPLPPKPSSPPSLSPYAPSPDPLARPHAHFEPALPPRDHALAIPTLARAAAALQAGHLPSSAQLLALCDLLLASPLLDDDPKGTVWEPTYGEGRIGTGGLSREGERVRLAARECVWSVRELVEGRNPVLSEQDGEMVGATDAGVPGDGWQEFLWRCRGSEVDIDLPSPHLPSASPSTLRAASSSLLTLLHLLLTSPALRSLLSDFVLLLRDTADALLETAQAKDRLGPGTVEALEHVVEAVAEGAVGASTIRAHDDDPEALSKRPFVDGAHGERVLDVKEGAPDPPVVELELDEGENVQDGERQCNNGDEEAEKVDVSGLPQSQKSPEELKDEFVDRFTAILIQLQATPAYQRAMQTLLSVARTYLRDTLSAATPHVAIEPADPPSSPTAKLAPSNPDDPTALLLPLLEPFTGGPGSLAPLRSSLHALLAHLDPSTPGAAPARLRALAASLDTFLSRALLTPGWASTAAAHRSLASLHSDLSALSADSPALARAAAALLSHAQDALAVFAGDALLLRAVGSVEELALAVGAWAAEAAGTAARAAGGEGVAAVWGDVVEWVVPRVMGVLKEVPLPRLEFASPSISLAIDPPSLLSTSFIPSSVSLRQSTSLTYLPVSGTSSIALPPSSSSSADPALSHAPAAARTAYAASTLLAVEGVQLELRDVGYFAQYHTGIPCLGSVSESGLLDLRFGRAPAPASSSGGAGGLGFTLSTTSPAPAGAHALFALNRSATHVHLRDFALTPHRSSHPWVMWALRPLLRAAVRTTVEEEARGALERAAEWVARSGWRVKEREGELRREEEEGEGETRTVWRWVRAAWDVLVGGEEEEEPPAPVDATEEDADSPTQEEADDDDDGSHPAWHLHLNQHGLAVDLEAAHGTVGLGAEGVVLPAGAAPIPPPEGHDPPKGLVRAARDEVRSEVRAGKEAARGAMNAVGEVGEVGEEAERWEESTRKEKRVRPDSWRSEAFDLR
ncbi:hypothetical protein JCM10450v2_007966 [Rhodotorula kratochvilovae]